MRHATGNREEGKSLLQEIYPLLPAARLLSKKTDYTDTDYTRGKPQVISPIQALKVSVLFFF